ncbi:MAG: hypothetical protein V7696_17360 [Halioglobus sp.]
MKVSTVCLGFIAACGLVTSMQSRADTAGAGGTLYPANQPDGVHGHAAGVNGHVWIRSGAVAETPDRHVHP